MLLGGEMQLFCDVMKKSRIPVLFASPDDFLGKIVDKGFASLLENLNIANIPIKDIVGDIEPNTVYKVSGSSKLCYIYFILPETREKTIIFVGPYLHTSMSVQDILEICEKKHIPFKNQKILSEYFSGIPVINENSHLFVMLESLCERIWGINNFSVTDINQEWEAHVSPININSSTDLEETLANISLMEKRYNYENELIQAVSLGQTHKVDQLLTGLNELSFEKRSSDPLRNMKNYCIIMNTLFRKAAESGGVMPIYLDKVSSDFAYKIEQVSSLSAISLLMKEIFRSYCRLVRKHSMKNYSPIVQKTIIFIESDLSSNLTLSSLAGMQNVSGGYLSSIFKKETGKTVTEYIREKRIKHAIHLLTTTHLQIQTVAANCGILDLQYFSKIFKKHTGMTPKEYRDSAKIKK